MNIKRLFNRTPDRFTKVEWAMLRDAHAALGLDFGDDEHAAAYRAKARQAWRLKSGSRDFLPSVNPNRIYIDYAESVLGG